MSKIVEEIAEELKLSAETVKKDSEDINKIINDSKEDSKIDDKSLEMFNEINKTVMNVLTDKSISDAFISIKEKAGIDLSQDLTELIAASVTIATYNAIAYYDMQLKDLMFENFHAFNDQVLHQQSEIEFLQKSLGEFKKQIDLEKLNQLYNA